MRYVCVLCPTVIFDRLSAPFQINRRIQIQTVANIMLTSSLKRWRAVQMPKCWRVFWTFLRGFIIYRSFPYAMVGVEYRLMRCFICIIDTCLRTQQCSYILRNYQWKSQWINTKGLNRVSERQILLYPQDNLSPVLCHAPVSRAWWTSSAGHVTVTRAVPRQWWSTWPEGHSCGMAPVVATSKGQSRPPGRRPLWPTQTHLLHPMAPKWSSLTEGALS